ncbi:MAG: hypothetical protein U0795_15315 [Pirellulales bacterium]
MPTQPTPVRVGRSIAESIRRARTQATGLACVGMLICSACLVAQDTPLPAAAPADRPALAVMTTQEDHQQMLGQLGITKLRPGPSGDPNAPNHANYDEASANPYPNLPELMKLSSGEQVTTAEQWWHQRRPEIVAAFEQEVLGRVPSNVPKVTWELRETRDAKVGEHDVVEKHLVGVVDNSTCPEIEVQISMSLTLPKQANGPVPVLMMFGRTPFDPVPPGWERFQRGPTNGQRGGSATPSREGDLIEAGWGFAMLNPGSVQDDAGGERPRRTGPAGGPGPGGAAPNTPAAGEGTQPAERPRGGGLTRGIIGLTNGGQPRKPDDWGALRAWAWGASRGLDYLLTDPTVDGRRVGIEGVSRYGKAALVTLAFDDRFAMGLIGSSGEGGASLYRRNFGEAVENLTGSGEYHWMAGNFLKYGADESSFGRRDANDLPVDAHQLIALCAPRLTFISYGVPDKGDALWLDQQGSFMATVAAQPAFRLLGARDLGRTDDYRTEKMPPVNEGLLEGDLAWRQHDGGHTDGPNMAHFIHWANARFQARFQPRSAAP